MQGGGQGQHAFQCIVVRTAAADHGVNLVKAQLQLFYLCRNGQRVRAGVAHGKLLILGDLFALLRRGQDVSAAAVQKLLLPDDDARGLVGVADGDVFQRRCVQRVGQRAVEICTDVQDNGGKGCQCDDCNG